jgi:hypothetical protein
VLQLPKALWIVEFPDGVVPLIVLGAAIKSEQISAFAPTSSDPSESCLALILCAVSCLPQEALDYVQGED